MNRIQGEPPSNSKWWEGDADNRPFVRVDGRYELPADLLKAPVDHGEEFNASSLDRMRAALRGSFPGLSHRDHLWKDGEE